MELLVIVPLLLAVLIMNYVLINYIEQTNSELEMRINEYSQLLNNQTYFKDPVSGNSYPISGGKN